MELNCLALGVSLSGGANTSGGVTVYKPIFRILLVRIAEM
jgi:hypothetical protein